MFVEREDIGSTTASFGPAFVLRLFAVYFAFLIGSSIFSNWRHFPSVDFNVALDNWGKFFFYVLFAAAPYLLLSQVVALIFTPKTRSGYLVLADLVFIAFYLLEPVSLFFQALQALGGAGKSSFSFGVSEGEIIRDGVVTELGKSYYFMNKMKDVLNLAIFFVMRPILFRLWFLNAFWNKA
jgi:hypothetical protein